MTQVAIRMNLRGRVQGLGVRPAVARLARALSLSGWVGNTGAGLEIVAQGERDPIDQFTRELSEHLPANAVVESRICLPVDLLHCAEFSIRHTSTLEIPNGTLKTRVPQDLMACDACLHEIHNGAHRRAGYPLTSCTACGPRYTILEAMPYERNDTTMGRFPLCQECQREYELPDDRRFHAQTNACPQCGPNWFCRDGTGTILAWRQAATRMAVEAILRGDVLAAKGLGSYQLIVDATSDQAVNRLRHRKQRMLKPLAIMVRSVEEAQRIAWCNEAERRALESAAGPVVILQAKPASNIARNVSPELNSLGVMLPTTPLHALLLQVCQRPLVVTSGNREGEPPAFEPDNAMHDLASVADLWLEHDRPIRRPIDDSVVRVMAGRVAVFRSARGFAPLPLDVNSAKPLLAVGGHQKGAIALHNGEQAVLGPHVGDLDSVAARERWNTQVEGLQQLYGTTPTHVACDFHPDYASTHWANRKSVSSIPVQHHHAHVVAGMLEQHWCGQTVLGVAFDGTGLGDDGTIWGGEFLVSTNTQYRRVGHLVPFQLPGGEQAVRQPWRIAVALVQQAIDRERAMSLCFDSGRPQSLWPLLGKKSVSPITTSVGRLFDGIAALVLGLEISQYEGQGPMLLEAISDRSEMGRYAMPLTGDSPFQLDWRPAVAQIVGDWQAGEQPGAIAMRFHRGLAHAVIKATQRFGRLPVVLCGGCFQNQLLVELLLEQAPLSRQPWGIPGAIPVNDGGLAAGQLAVAAARATFGKGE